MHGTITEVAEVIPHAEARHDHHGAPSPDLPRKIMDALRGRYLIAIGLGLLLGVPIAAAAYMLVKPKFQAIGLIVVNTRPTVVLTRIEETQPITNADSLVASEMAIIQSERILASAASDANLQKVRWPGGAEGRALLRSALSVSAPKRAATIQVSVAHVDAQTSAVAVNAILDAYDRIKQDSSLSEQSERMRTLEELIATSRNKKELANRQIRELAAPLTPETLQQLLDSKIEQFRQADAERLKQEMVVAGLEAAPAPAVVPSLAPDSDEAITQELSAKDESFRRLVEQLRSLKREQDSSGLRPSHREYQRRQRDIDSIQGEVTRLVADHRARTRPVPAEVVANEGEEPAAPTVTVNPTLAEARIRAQNFAAICDAFRKDIEEMSAKVSQIRELRDQATAAEADETRASTRAEELRIELLQNPVTRVQVFQRAIPPAKPNSDKRMLMAGGGGGAGFMAGFCLVALFGLARGNLRYSKELHSPVGVAPLLAAIPDLRRLSDDDEPMAALSVHHLRSMLDARSSHLGLKGDSYAVTSPTSGDGKTNLAASLAASFAATGRRVVAVDMDLLGRGLTTQMGFGDHAGLQEALDGRPIGDCVHQTRTDNLWVLPIGVLANLAPHQLAVPQVRRLIDSLRGRFDLLMIDTGPILGSLEACVASSVAEQTLLVVGRGQRSNLVKAAADQLTRIGARCAGLVFNRATAVDLAGSVSSISASRASIRSQPQLNGDHGNHRRPRAERSLISSMVEATDDRAA